jgi:hypothetical protein
MAGDQQYAYRHVLVRDVPTSTCHAAPEPPTGAGREMVAEPAG